MAITLRAMRLSRLEDHDPGARDRLDVDLERLRRRLLVQLRPGAAAAAARGPRLLLQPARPRRQRPARLLLEYA